MPQITGIIEAMSSKTVNTKNGPKQNYSLMVNGVWIGGFKEFSAQKGDNVTVDYTENGNFKNIVSVTGGTPSDAPYAQPQMSTPRPNEAYDPNAGKVVPKASSVSYDAKQNMIVAQNALAHATALLIARDEQKDAKATALIIEYAGIFARAVVNGDLYKEPSFAAEPKDPAEKAAPQEAFVDDIPF